MNPRQTATLAYDPPETGSPTLALVPLVAVLLLAVSYPMYAAVAVGGVAAGLAVATVWSRLAAPEPRPGRPQARL
ncbi:MAG: hypothetical protein ABEJ22_06980 [Haloferacaceae archaeon]